MSGGLVIFGEDWGVHPSATQHLAMQLVRNHKIIWINSIGLRRPKLCLSDLARIRDKLLRRRRQKMGVIGTGEVTGSDREALLAGAEVPAGVRVVEPRVLSWPGNPLVQLYNRFSLGRQIRGILREEGIVRPVLLISLPTAVSMVGSMDEAGIIYYCGDDFSALAGVDHVSVAKLEAKLATRADHILVASEALMARFDRSRTQELPHGVDAGAFFRTVSRPVEMPEGKVAVFIGSLAEWLDVKLLVSLAKLRTDWQFALVGPDRGALDGIVLPDNLRCMGAKPYTELPAWLQHADVALIPFRDTPQIRSCNPLKLREYLASGVPVISTDFPALAKYRDLVQVATDAAGFAAALDTCDHSAEAVVKRRQAVASASWFEQAKQVEFLIKMIEDGVSSC